MAKDIHAARIVMKTADGAKQLASRLSKNKDITDMWLRRHDDKQWEVEFFAKCNKVCKSNGLSGEITAWLGKSNSKALGVSVSQDVIFVKKM